MQTGNRKNSKSGKLTRKRLSGIVLTVLVAAVAFPIAWTFVSSYHEQQASEAKVSIPIRLKDLEGNTIELAEFSGKVVFINFWATWCAPCIAEMPSIQRASEKLPADRVVFLVASNEPVDRIEEFRKRNKIELQYAQLENQEELGIQVLPTTFIIDRSGKKVFSEVGSRQWDAPENIKLLNEIIDHE